MLEEEVEHIPVSEKSLRKADEIIVRGLRRAMESPPRNAEEIWSDFDKLRVQIQSQVHSAAALNVRGKHMHAQEKSP